MSTRDLSDKQRIWLEHVEACVAGGGSMKAYADRQGGRMPIRLVPAQLYAS